VKKSKPNQAADLPEPQPAGPAASAAAAASAASEASAGSGGRGMPASQERIPSPENPEGRFINTVLNLRVAAISKRIPYEKLGIITTEQFLLKLVKSVAHKKESHQRVFNDL
jgi:hypothetical protein